MEHRLGGSLPGRVAARRVARGSGSESTPRRSHEPERHQALDHLACKGRERLRATMLMVAVEERGRLVVRGASGAGEAQLVDRGLVVDGPPPGPRTESARLYDAAGRDLVLSTRHDRSSGVGVWAAAAAGDPRILVLGRGRKGAAAVRRQESLDWVQWAAARIVTADRQSVEERLRNGLAVREAERRRWARELHDETLQELGALQVLLGSTLRRADRSAGHAVLDALDLASELVGRQTDALRALIAELRPAGLDELGLQAPLETLARRTQASAGVHVELQLHLRDAAGLAATRLHPDIEVAVYRVVQEALSNARRHSGASRLWVSVVEDDDVVDARVVDDGRGLGGGPATGFGILGMRERAELAGGRLEVTPGRPGARGGGTTVRLVVPAVHLPPDPPPAAARPYG